jgi:hypothetical protein
MSVSKPILIIGMIFTILLTISPAAQAVNQPHGHESKRAKSHWYLRPPAIRLEVRNSTAYCDSGIMANGKNVYDGAVAVPQSESLGRWYQVRSGPYKGRVLHAVDHIGSGSEFDIWMKGGCEAYGRRNILIAQISSTHARKVLWRLKHPRPRPIPHLKMKAWVKTHL